MLEHVDPGAIADPATRALVLELMNLVDSLVGQLQGYCQLVTCRDRIEE
jgi:hypothetical protein